MLGGDEEADKAEEAEAEEADLAEEEEVEEAEVNPMAPQPLTPVILEGATRQQSGGPSLQKRWPSAGRLGLGHLQVPDLAQLELLLPLKSQLQRTPGMAQASQGLEVAEAEQPSDQYGPQQSLT